MRALPRTIRDQVTDRIRDQVVSGELAPGEALKEIEFARRLGVSRGPVRDAFLRLALEGLLEYRPNRGVTVSLPPKPENRPLIASLRTQIESEAVRRGVAALSDDEIDAIEGELSKLRAACEEGEQTAVARADIAFHEALLVACGGSDFLPIWTLLCTQMLICYARLSNYDEVYREHARIFEGVRARDPERIAEALEVNIQ